MVKILIECSDPEWFNLEGATCRIGVGAGKKLCNYEGRHTPCDSGRRCAMGAGRNCLAQTGIFWSPGCRDEEV